MLTAPRTIAGQVAERLKEEILAGEREPGSRLRQVEIAQRLGVSTTPVREALAMLQREGLVRLNAQRGAVSIRVEVLTGKFRLCKFLVATPGPREESA